MGLARFVWSSPRLAFFLIFWTTIFFVGSIFVVNPFVSGGGSFMPFYWWVVFYMHGLMAGMVGLGALVACDVLEIASTHVRKGIWAGVLFAGILVPIGGVFDQTPPATTIGMWVQVAGFAALDEIVIFLLWGVLEQWRAGAWKTRTLPYISVSLAGVAMLVAALMGHLGGWIITFGNWPNVLGWYASQQGETVNMFAQNLAFNHAYLMLTAIVGGIVSMAAIKFGYYNLKGWTRTVARTGLFLVSVGILIQIEMEFLSGFTNWMVNTPDLITSMSVRIYPNGMSWVGVNDMANFLTVMLGGFLTLAAVAGGRIDWQALRSAFQKPLLLGSILSFVLIFAFFVTELEPVGVMSLTNVGPPNLAWIRLYVGFFLSVAIMVVALAAYHFLPTRYHDRIGWALSAGVGLVFTGGMIYVLTNSKLGGYVAVAGLVVVGVAFILTAWCGWTADSSVEVVEGHSDVYSVWATGLPRQALSPLTPRASAALFVSLGVLVLLIVGGAGMAFYHSQTPVPPASGTSPVQYVNITITPGSGGGQAKFLPGNFTLTAMVMVIFTITVKDTALISNEPSNYSMVRGTMGNMENVSMGMGDMMQSVNSIPMSQMGHSFTLVGGPYDINIPIPAATSSSSPVTVSASVMFNQKGMYMWNCDPGCLDTSSAQGGGMGGTLTVT